MRKSLIASLAGLMLCFAGDFTSSADARPWARSYRNAQRNFNRGFRRGYRTGRRYGGYGYRRYSRPRSYYYPRYGYRGYGYRSFGYNSPGGGFYFNY